MQPWVWNYTLEPSGLTDRPLLKRMTFSLRIHQHQIRQQGEVGPHELLADPWQLTGPVLHRSMQATIATMSSCLWWLCCASKTALGSHSPHLQALTPFLLPFPWYSLDLRRDGGINDLFRANLSTVTHAEHVEQSWFFCTQYAIHCKEKLL